jgi:hypothetical protein
MNMTMKKLVFLYFLLMLVTGIRAQIVTDPRTEEYATIRVVISASTGNISPSTNLPNPQLEVEGASMELKDFVKDSKGVKFETVTNMLNYMNKFSWLLLSSHVVNPRDLKTDDFIVYYTFKRKSKTK